MGTYEAGIFFSKTFYSDRDSQCMRCNCWIRRGEPSMFVDKKFGHNPISIEHCSDGVLIVTCPSGAQTRFYGGREVSRWGFADLEPFRQKGCEVSDIDSRISATEKVLANLYAEAEKIKKYGKDSDYENGSILVLKTPIDGTKTAIKCSAGRWKIGNSEHPFDHLVQYWLVTAKSVSIVTQIEDL